MEVKVVCGCGQKYVFDVEPVHGRMPVRVVCPTCGADGTEAANNILAQYFPNQSTPTPVLLSARPVQSPVAAPAPPPLAAAPLTRPSPLAPRPIVPLKRPGPATKPTWYQYIWICVPLVLVIIGGCIGGACGGGAAALNYAVFQKVSNPVLKYVWTGLISAGAFIAWLVIVAVLLGMLQGLGGR